MVSIRPPFRHAPDIGTASLHDPAAPGRIAAETATVLERLGEGSVRGVIGSLVTD